MRDRRWRRLVDADRDRQRQTARAPGGRVRNWLRSHIVASIGIIGLALAAVLTGWLNGFFDSILHDVVPSGTEAACSLHEAVKYNWPFATPQATSDRFTILIATIDRDDADHTYTRAVARAFFKRDGIDRIETCRVLRLSDVGRDAEIIVATTARIWLEQRHADLLIGGELLKRRTPSRSGLSTKIPRTIGSHRYSALMPICLKRISLRPPQLSCWVLLYPPSSQREKKGEDTL
jgi:hypothetical protein